jgi:hypothetical protein
MKRLVIAGFLVAMVVLGLSGVGTQTGQAMVVTYGIDSGNVAIQPVWLLSDDPNDPNEPNDPGTGAPE